MPTRRGFRLNQPINPTKCAFLCIFLGRGFTFSLSYYRKIIYKRANLIDFIGIFFMKPLTKLLMSTSFAALFAGCASVPGEITDRNDPEGYERITKRKVGESTVYDMRNGCIVTETTTREPDALRYRAVMTCPWDQKKVEP